MALPSSLRRALLPVTALALACAVAGPVTGAPAPADCATTTALTPAYQSCEGKNLTITGQNQSAHPELVPGIFAATAAYQQARFAAIAADPERQPNPNSCTTSLLCPIDPRMNDFAARGGIVRPVLYTSRSGATMSGHVWATVAGPATRPGIVLVNGSIVGFEETYWFLAEALAKAGFEVLTFDAQGEGMSDQLGEFPDQLEDAFAGSPLAGLVGPRPLLDGFGGNGYPFYDGGQDALDFLLSTPAHPYVPRPSRTTGTSHAAKQARRVASGRNAAYNPLWSTLDPSSIGITGHSYGAVAASWLGQADPRIDAVVALDSLCLPVSPAPSEQYGAYPNPDFNGLPGMTYGLPRDCFSAPAGPAPALTKPALGIAGDYLLNPVPYLLPPNPLAKSRASLAYSAAGDDTGQVLVRGGTHLSFTDIPFLVPGSLRAIDMITWYTTAWFAKYLQHRPGADAMLLTDRWQHDAATGTVDPVGDANLLSWHFRSRLDVAREGGGRVRCENLRTGCGVLVPSSTDGWAGEYSIVSATR